MTVLHTDPLVADYLRRLETAAAGLPPQRRTELVAQVREHVDEALRAPGAPGEADLRNVPERLGPPEEIVDADHTDPPTGRGRVGALEVVALVALLVSLALALALPPPRTWGRWRPRSVLLADNRHVLQAPGQLEAAAAHPFRQEGVEHVRRPHRQPNGGPTMFTCCSPATAGSGDEQDAPPGAQHTDELAEVAVAVGHVLQDHDPGGPVRQQCAAGPAARRQHGRAREVDVLARDRHPLLEALGGGIGVDHQLAVEVPLDRPEVLRDPLRERR